MKRWIFLLVFSFAIFAWDGAESACSLPTDLQGTFIDTLKGSLVFNNSIITGYHLHDFGELTLTCWMQNDTVYIFESTEFEYFSLNFTAYFCWNFTQVSSDMYYFYEYSSKLQGAGYERVRAYLPTLDRVYESICSNPDPGLGTYRVLFREGTLASAVSPCPMEIQAQHSVTVQDNSGTDACNGTSFGLDVCSNSSAMIYNNSDCHTYFAYSDSGYIYCLFTVEDPANDMLYMSLYNDGQADDTSTYAVTCMIVNYVAKLGYMAGTQYPKQCPDTMNETYVPSPGAYVNLYNAGSCTEVSAFPWWILGVVGGLLFLIGLIILLCCYKKKRDEEEKKRRNLLDDEDDDERFDPERLARGDRPPFVSITIMGSDSDRKRDKNGRLVDDPDGPIDIKRPKSEGGKRRLDKRKRVWVVDKDGKVKKVWKDARDSPDSGVEDDDDDGEGGSTGRKTLSSQEEKEKEMTDAEWAKKHGRKGLKSAGEIVEKGDRKKGSAKLQTKMKGIVSAKRSARYRKSARSAMSRASRMDKSANYKAGHEDDGDRSWGSSDGEEYEEVIIENEPDSLESAREAAENKRNEEMELQRQLENKGVSKDKLQGKSDIALAATTGAVATTTVISETEKKKKKEDKNKKMVSGKEGEKGKGAKGKTDGKETQTLKEAQVKTDDKDTKGRKPTDAKGRKSTDIKDGKSTDTKKGRTTDTKDGKATDTKDGKPTDTKDVKTTDDKKGKPTDTKDGKATDDKKGKPTDTKDGKATDGKKGKPTDTKDGKATDDKKGKPTDTKDGKATDDKKGKLTDTKDGKPTDDKKGKPTDTKDGKATDDKKGKPTDTKDGKATDDKKGKPTDTKDGKATDDKKGKPTDTKDGKATDAKKTTDVKAASKEKTEPSKKDAASTSQDADKVKTSEDSKGKGKGKKSTIKDDKTVTVKEAPSSDKITVASDSTDKSKDAGDTVGDPKISGKDAAPAGAAIGAAVAVVALTAAEKKLEAQKKKEQKEREKAEKKKAKEEKLRKEKEEKEMKKKAKEAEKQVAKYVDVQPADKEKTTSIVESEENEKKMSEKGDQDSGHLSLDQVSDTDKKSDKGPDTQTNVSRDPLPVSASLKPRREQSIVLDLDRSKSTIGIHDKKPSSSEKKSLEVMSELVDNAREKADAFAEGKDIQSPMSSADERSRLPPPSPVKGAAVVAAAVVTESVWQRSKSASSKGSKQGIIRGDASPGRGKDPDDKESDKTEKKTTQSKKTEHKETVEKGAKESKGSAPVTKINVNEAAAGSKTDLSKTQNADESEQEGDESDSSEEEITPVRKKRPQGFTFPDEMGVASTFRATGDVILAMPVKKKRQRRKPMKQGVDMLPSRTSQAFGLAPKGKPVSASVAPGTAAKGTTSKPPSAGTKGQTGDSMIKVAPAKGPITIKDLSKKKPDEVDSSKQNKASVGPLESADSAESSGRSMKTSPSPNRRKSELDKKQHLQLMTQLMSLPEGPESEGPSRVQSRKETPKVSSAIAKKEAIELGLVGIGDQSDRGKNGTPELLHTARQDGVVAGRPPTMHSIRPSRESSAAPRGTSGLTVHRSHSDKRTTSVTFPDSSRTGGSHSSSSTNSEDRFQRFKQGVMKQLGELGKQDLNAIYYPRVQRYPEDEEDGRLKRGTPAYRSMGTLQRIHKRNRQVAPCELPPIKGAYGGLIDDYDDIDDPRMRGLLEELYRDKKYLDKSLATDPIQSSFVRQRTMEGRDFLLNRARFWSTQKPIVRPGTQQGGSRASTAMPSSRLAVRPDTRSRSEERPSDESEKEKFLNFNSNRFIM